MEHTHPSPPSEGGYGAHPRAAATFPPGALAWAIQTSVQKPLPPRSLDWGKVIAGLDKPDWVLADMMAFSRLAKAFTEVVGAPFPLPPLLGNRWNNAAAQLSLLKAATSDQGFSFA